MAGLLTELEKDSPDTWAALTRMNDFDAHVAVLMMERGFWCGEVAGLKKAVEKLGLKK